MPLLSEKNFQLSLLSFNSSSLISNALIAPPPLISKAKLLYVCMISKRSCKAVIISVENPMLQKVDKLKDAEYLKMLKDVKVDSTDPEVFIPFCLRMLFSFLEILLKKVKTPILLLPYRRNSAINNSFVSNFVCSPFCWIG